MTEPQSQPQPPHKGAEPANIAARIFKGCGCVTGLGVLGFGILWIGGFDSASWASAILGLLIAVLVFGLSGVNGWWEK